MWSKLFGCACVAVVTGMYVRARIRVVEIRLGSRIDTLEVLLDVHKDQVLRLIVAIEGKIQDRALEQYPECFSIEATRLATANAYNAAAGLGPAGPTPATKEYYPGGPCKPWFPTISPEEALNEGPFKPPQTPVGDVVM